MTNIGKIVRAERAADVAFMKKQKAELDRLNDLLARKSRGETIDTSDIRKHLQDSGVLDKNGNLTKIYDKGIKK